MCERLRKVATALECAVLVVHHSGKDVSKGMRGSSAILGAVDYTLLVEEGKNASSVKVEKMRDASKAQALRFKRIEVVIGKDEDGEDVTSCIIRPAVVGEGLDLAVDEDEEVPLKRCGDKRDDHVEMLIGAIREEAERTCRADDEELSDIGLTAVELGRLLNQARQHCCSHDGKPFAELDRKGVSRVIDTAVQSDRLSVRGSKFHLK